MRFDHLLPWYRLDIAIAVIAIYWEEKMKGFHRKGMINDGLELLAWMNKSLVGIFFNIPEPISDSPQCRVDFGAFPFYGLEVFRVLLMFL